MRYSSFTSVTDISATLIEEDWGAFVTRMSRPQVVADKAGVGLFSGSTYTDGKRKNTSAEACSMLVLDFDNAVHGQKVMVEHPVSIELIEMMLQGTYEYVIVTSHSHTPEWPRFRVVLPLAKPVEARFWGLYAKHALSELDFDHFEYAIDPCYRKVAQCYYWPSHPPGAQAVFRHGTGRPLDGVLPGTPVVAQANKAAHPGTKSSPFTREQVSAFWSVMLPEMEQTPGDDEWKAPCPLHGGKNLKFNVNPATGMWHCKSKCVEPFKGGDIYRFQELIGKLDFKTAKSVVHSVIGGEPGERLTPEELEVAIDAASPEMLDDLKREIARQGTVDRNRLMRQLVTTHQVDPDALKAEIRDMRKVLTFPKANPDLAAAVAFETEAAARVAEGNPDAYGLCLDPRRYEINETGIYQVRTTTSRSTGSVMYERQTPPLADKPIWPAALGTDLATGQTFIKLAWLGSKGVQHAEWLPGKVLGSRDALAQLDDAPVGLDNSTAVAGFLRYAKTAMVSPILNITSAVGWVNDNTRFVLSDDPEYEYIGPEIETRGTVEGWAAGLVPLLEMGAEGFIGLAVLGLSAASPFVRLAQRRNPVIGLVAESSKGKGKVIEYGLAVWGAPSSMTLPAGTSEKGLQDIGTSRPDFPIFLDELQQTAKKDLLIVENILYYFGNGQRRVTSSRNQTAKGGERRYGVSFFAAEEDVLQTLQKGAQNRVIPLYGNPLRDAKMAAVLQTAAKDNCGVVGARIADILNSDARDVHMAEIEVNAQNLVSSYPLLRGDDPYVVALVVQGLYLVSEVTGIRLPIDALQDWLVAQLTVTRSAAKDAAEAAFVYMLEALLSMPWGGAGTGSNKNLLMDDEGYVAFRMGDVSARSGIPLEVVPSHRKVVSILRDQQQTSRVAGVWAKRGWLQAQSRNMKWYRSASAVGGGIPTWRITEEGLALVGLNAQFEPIED